MNGVNAPWSLRSGKTVRRPFVFMIRTSWWSYTVNFSLYVLRKIKGTKILSESKTKEHTILSLGHVFCWTINDWFPHIIYCHLALCLIGWVCGWECIWQQEMEATKMYICGKERSPCSAAQKITVTSVRTLVLDGQRVPQFYLINTLNGKK